MPSVINLPSGAWLVLGACAMSALVSCFWQVEHLTTETSASVNRSPCCQAKPVHDFFPATIVLLLTYPLCNIGEALTCDKILILHAHPHMPSVSTPCIQSSDLFKIWSPFLRPLTASHVIFPSHQSTYILNLGRFSFHTKVMIRGIPLEALLGRSVTCFQCHHWVELYGNYYIF